MALSLTTLSDTSPTKSSLVFSGILLACLYLFISGCDDTNKNNSLIDHHLELGNTFLKQGLLDSTFEQVRNISMVDPKNYQAHILHAKALLLIGGYQQAAEHLTTTLTLYPTKAEALSLWCQTHLKLKKADIVLQKLGKTSAAFQNSTDAKLLKAEAYLLKDQLDKASELLTPLVRSAEQAVTDLPVKEATDTFSTKKERLVPEATLHARALSLQASVLLKAQQLEAADEFLNKAALLDQNNTDILFQQGVLDQTAERFKEAEEHFSSALLEISHFDKMTRQKYTTLEHLVKVLIAQGKQDDALRYTRALSTSPQGKLLNKYKQAIKQYQAGDLKDAGNKLEQILEETPNNQYANNALALVKLSQGAFQDAENLLLNSWSQEEAREKLENSSATDQDESTNNNKDSKKDKPDSIARLLIATQLKLGKLESALKGINLLLEKSPNDFELRTTKAYAIAKQGDFKTASTLLKGLLTEKPKNPRALSTKGFIELQMGKYPDAQITFFNLAKRFPENTPSLLNLAKVDAALGLTEFPSLKRIIKKFPKSVPPRLILASAYLSSQRTDAAITTLNKSLNRFPDNQKIKSAISGAYYSKSVQLANQQNWDAALQAINSSLTHNDTESQPLILKARILSSSQQTEASREVIKIIGNKFQQSGIAETMEGDLLISEKRLTQAIASYEAAWEKQQNQSLGFKLMALKLKSQYTPSESLSHLKEWAIKNPKNSSAQLALGMAYQKNNDTKNAIAVYEASLKTTPSIIAANNLAWLLFEKKEIKKALFFAQQAYTGAPREPSIIDTYGWILLKTGKIKEGHALLKLAHELAPTNPDISAHYEVATQTMNPP